MYPSLFYTLDLSNNFTNRNNQLNLKKMIFTTYYIKDNIKYEGERIEAISFEDAERKALEKDLIVEGILIGEGDFDFDEMKIVENSYKESYIYN